MEKIEPTRFERNWTTFVNPALCAAWKSPPKMVVWNRPRGIRSQGYLFALPRWGNSKQRILNAIRRPSSTRLFALIGNAHPKWWYETDLVDFDPKGVYSLRPDGESRNDEFWTQFDDLRQPGFLRCLEKPTQNGGMKPTSWNSIPRVFLRFAPMGKVETTRSERNWTTFVNPAFSAAWKSQPKMVLWNRPRGIRSQDGFFDSPRWGKSKQRVLNAIGRPSSTRLFSLLWKANPKWFYETDLVEFDQKGFSSLRRDGESRNNAFWTQLDDLRQRGFLRCLEKPTQNGGMKQTSWNSIPRVFIRFAPRGKVETTRFERNWTTFVNPPFCAAWKGPLKMVAWNQPSGIRSQGCLFSSPRWGKSKQCVLNAIGRPSLTWLLALLGEAHPKWWYETHLVEFDPKGVYFAPMEKVETTNFERNLSTFVNPAFWAVWKSPPKIVVWKRPRGIRSQGCLCASPRWGKSKQRILNAIRRPSLTRLFALLGKAHPKWWYETDLLEFGSKGVSSLRPDGESRNNAFWTHLDDLRQPRFLRCLEKPTQNGGMKPTSSNLIPRVFRRFGPMRKVETTRFERSWTTFVNPAFCAAWKSPPKMVVWNRPRGFRSQGSLFASPRWGKSKERVLNAIWRPSSTRLFALLGKALPKWWYETDLVEFDPNGVYLLRPHGEVETTRFERNWTTFVNPAFCAAWKSPPKMVVWNRPRGIRSQGCLCASPPWGNSKQRILNEIRRLSSTRLLRCLEKPIHNGGMKPTTSKSIPRVFIRFAPMGKVKNTHFERNWTTFANPAFCAACKSPPKMVVWSRPRGIWSQGCLFASPRWGKSKQRVLNTNGQPSSTRLFALLKKAHPKCW